MFATMLILVGCASPRRRPERAEHDAPGFTARSAFLSSLETEREKPRAGRPAAFERSADARALALRRRTGSCAYAARGAEPGRRFEIPAPCFRTMNDDTRPTNLVPMRAARPAEPGPHSVLKKRIRAALRRHAHEMADAIDVLTALADDEREGEP